MFVLRSAVSSDIEIITEFNCRLAMETEDKPLNVEIVRRGVLRGLSLSPEVQYFVAEEGSAVVGQIMLTREWSDWRDGWMLWLQSVYVDSKWRGMGVFRSLLSYSVNVASQQADVVGIRLYVEHENEAAKACYRKLGFANAGYEVMEMPWKPRGQQQADQL